MLKISPYIPTLNERTILRSHMPFLEGKKFNLSAFSAIRDNFRNHLFQIQNGICAYCMGEVSSDVGELEHIAAKALFPKYLFHFRNLVLSCTTCNKNKKKHEKKIASNRQQGSHSSYERYFDFKIVHPILDTPAAHLLYDTQKIVLIRSLTKKGARTKKYLKLDYPYQTAQRAKVAKLRSLPLNPSHQRLLNRIASDFRLRKL